MGTDTCALSPAGRQGLAALAWWGPDAGLWPLGEGEEFKVTAPCELFSFICTVSIATYESTECEG